MKTYPVQFLPDDRTVRAAQGKSLLQAARAAGVNLNAICRGDGCCGKCRVVVKSGKVTAKPNMFLTRHDIQRGVALACQTYVGGPVTVEIPQESRHGGIPHLTSEDAIRYGKASDLVGKGAAFEHEPLARWHVLDLPAPAIDDPLSDDERIYRELRRGHDIPIMQMGLAILKRLPALLRENDCRISALLGYRGGTTELVDVVPADPKARSLGVAVDIGTTTLAAHLVDLDTSETLATMAKYNSQMGHGEDVISRIMYADTEEHLAELQRLAASDINDLISALVLEAGVRLSDVLFVMCAGNTTMVHLLFGLDPANIRRDPYVPCTVLPPVIRAAEVGISINARGLLGTIPCVSSYVGGDIVADVLVTGMTRSDDLSLLIDVGTNGELVLGNADWQLCCSASAGPAFEGGGITCGMRATTGAIERITLGRGGSIANCQIVGGGKPLGICGSGLIDLVAELLRVDCIDRRGRFRPPVCGKRLRPDDSGVTEFVLVPGEETDLGRDIVITEPDISNFIHSKGSIYMAAESLLGHVGMAFTDITKIYIAGGFGNYLRIPNAISVGLLPDLPAEVFQFIGNGSVQGAKMVLLSRQAQEYVERQVAGSMTNIDLSTSHSYMNGYTSCLFLPHTALERFPSQLAADRQSRQRVSVD